MSFIAQNRIPDIIVVRHLHLIKKNHILKLCGIAYHSSFSNQSAAADKGTVAHLGFPAHNNRPVQKRGRSDLCGLMDPHIAVSFFVFFRIQAVAQSNYKIADSLKRVPGILKS